MPSPTVELTNGRIVCVESAVDPPLKGSGSSAMNVRGLDPELRFCAKSSPWEGVIGGTLEADAVPVYVQVKRWRCTSPDQGAPGDGSNDARKLSPLVCGAFTLATPTVPDRTGEYAGVVRVVACFAMLARMAPRAFWRSPGVSAK